MDEFAEYIATGMIFAFVVSLMLVGIGLILGIVSLPFALIGWAISTVASMFTTIEATYLNSVAVGIVTAFIVNVMIVVVRK